MPKSSILLGHKGTIDPATATNCFNERVLSQGALVQIRPLYSFVRAMPI